MGGGASREARRSAVARFLHVQHAQPDAEVDAVLLVALTQARRSLRVREVRPDVTFPNLLPAFPLSCWRGEWGPLEL
jgi:hypothetical protein